MNVPEKDDDFRGIRDTSKAVSYVRRSIQGRLMNVYIGVLRPDIRVRSSAEGVDISGTRQIMTRIFRILLVNCLPKVKNFREVGKSRQED